MKHSDAASLLIAFVALTISFAAYYQSVREHSDMSMQILEFTVEQRRNSSPLCKVDVALFNSGNRDAALIRVMLTQGKTVLTPSGYGTANITYSPGGDSPGYAPHVLKGGEVQLLSFVFDGCTPDTVRKAISTSGLLDLSLVTETLTYDGIRSVVSTMFATAAASSDTQLTFALQLDGHFDLLADRAFHLGQTTRGSREMWLKGSGTKWEQGYTTGASFRSAPPKQIP